MGLSSDLLYVSTSSVSAKDISEAITILSGITENIELSGGGRYDAGLLEKLIKIKKEKGINFLLHGYFPPPKKAFVLNFADTASRAFIEETMNYVRALQIPYYSVHTGFKRVFSVHNELLLESGNPQVFTLKGIQSNIEWFQKEFPDKILVLENLYPNNNNKECCFMMHIDEIIEIMERFGSVYMLFDLGHLKVSSRLLGFNYLNAVELLFREFFGRILEIHLSENNGISDDHLLIHSDSIQHMVIKRYAGIINEQRVNVTIESRGCPLEDLSECLMMMDGALRV